MSTALGNNQKSILQDRKFFAISPRAFFAYRLPQSTILVLTLKAFAQYVSTLKQGKTLVLAYFNIPSNSPIGGNQESIGTSYSQGKRFR